MENYLYSLIDKVFSTTNQRILHQYFIQNFDIIMKLNMIFNVSFTYLETKIEDEKELIKHKSFVMNHLKSK